MIASGRTRTIDVACVNGFYYLTEASIGISSRLARLQKPQEKQRFGLLAIVASVLQGGTSRSALSGRNRIRRQAGTFQSSTANGCEQSELWRIYHRRGRRHRRRLARSVRRRDRKLLAVFSVAGVIAAGKRRSTRDCGPFGRRRSTSGRAVHTISAPTASPPAPHRRGLKSSASALRILAP